MARHGGRLALPHARKVVTDVLTILGWRTKDPPPCENPEFSVNEESQKMIRLAQSFTD